MNEATLEARLNAELQRIFPTLGALSISHQDVFTLRFGHKLITINGQDNDKAFGRYDVLIKIDEKPIILFELKRPGKELLADDRDQGLSYARLLDSMPPLLVISNGQETEFYTTYDKKPWITDTIDDEALKTLISHGLACAAAEKDDAVKLLLGQQPQIWTDIIKQFTVEKLNVHHGKLKDLTYPLSKDFSLPRKIRHQIAKQLVEGRQLIALVGPPLSGKSNVVSQICSGETEGLVPLYIDGSSLRYGVLQYLANIFARDFFLASSATEIRNWLLTGLRNPVDGRLVIVIDGWSSNVSEQIRNDVEEIMDICKDGAVSILIAIDEYAFSVLTSVPGRPTKTELGHKMVKFNLDPLDDDEFELAMKCFYDNYKVCFHPGSQYNEEYRYPRVLRIIATQVSTKTLFDNKCSFFMLSITSVNFLSLMRRAFVEDTLLRLDLRKLAQAFANDKPERDADPYLAIVSYGRGFITYETAERVLGGERLTRLLSQGHLNIVNYQSDKALIIPRVPELLASAAVYFLTDEILDLINQGHLEKTYEYLVNSALEYPYGDIVAALTIVEVTKKRDDFLTFIIYKLIKDQPTIQELPGTFKGLSAIPTTMEPVPIRGEELSERKVIGNHGPWLILSHLANIRLATADSSRDVQLELLAAVGSFPYVLRRPDAISSKIVKVFHVHEWPGFGEVLCSKTGIVEPITQAMLINFYNIPKEMIRLCQHAIEEKKWFLLLRVHAAAQATETCADPEVAEASEEVKKMFDSIKDQLFGAMLTSCSNERRPRSSGQPKVGRNAPCPCGSGKKYKKCCGKS